MRPSIRPAGTRSKRSTPALRGSMHSSAEPDTRVTAASYTAGFEHSGREVISSRATPMRGVEAAALKKRSRMASSPGGAGDEQPFVEQLQQLVKKRKDVCVNSADAGGMADTNRGAGDDAPKTIGLKSSQKMLDSEDQVYVELTSASEEALDDARIRANKRHAASASAEVEEGMGQGNAPGCDFVDDGRVAQGAPEERSMDFDAAGEGHATSLNKGKGRASPTQNQRGPPSTAESSREEPAGKDGDYGDIYEGNQLGDPELYLQYYSPGCEAYGSGDGSGEGDDARCPDGEGAGLVEPAAERPVEAVANQEPNVNSGAAQEEEALANDARPEKPAYGNKTAPKPSKWQEQPDIAMVQESAARAGGNGSDGGDEAKEGDAGPEPLRGHRQDPPHAHSAAGLFHDPRQRDARKSIRRRSAGDRPSPRLPSSPPQRLPKAIKARQLTRAKATRGKHRRSGSPAQRESLSVRKERAAISAISAGRAPHGYMLPAAPGSSEGGDQQATSTPPSTQVHGTSIFPMHGR
ncbi:hypothetical protein BC834DRAFT_847360 [Gloeopeniophorella convolvens]|nr:hypothetical protein BC834DRAFT_847360 [Gloeopeniophorella convolvens]